MKRIDVAIAIVLRGSRLLIARRKSVGPLAGLWEFPGGKFEANETAEQCLARELREELAIRAKPVMSFPEIIHAYSHAQVCLHPFLCLHESGEPQLLGCDEVRWIDPADLNHFQFPPANTGLIQQIMDALPPSKARVIQTSEQSRYRKSTTGVA